MFKVLETKSSQPLCKVASVAFTKRDSATGVPVVPEPLEVSVILKLTPVLVILETFPSGNGEVVVLVRKPGTSQINNKYL